MHELIRDARESKPANASDRPLVGQWSVALVVFAAFLVQPSITLSQPIEIGMLESGSKSIDRTWHWQRALRGGGLNVRGDIEPDVLPEAADLPLLVLEDRCIDAGQADELAKWVRAGGTLIVNAPGCAEADQSEPASTSSQAELRLELAGLELGPIDPGLEGVYPRIVDAHPAISPFEAGDGIRLGAVGIDQRRQIHAQEAQVLARGYRLEPGPGDMIRPSRHPTVTLRRLGEGAVLYLHLSLGQVTACYPDSTGQPTDCSGAGTARALMRNIVANTLWAFRRIQAPLPWETPGSSKVNVVITGDVHADDETFQVRSARQMALALEDTGAPITYFISGKVARHSPEHMQALNDMQNVIIGSHSVKEEKYQPGFLEGAENIYEDIRDAETLLGQPSWPEQRQWLAAFRTHGWASDQTRAGAWTGLAEAGIGLVFDHNADSLLPRQHASAPNDWFNGDVTRRLFVPMIESSISTEVDEFLLDESLIDRIASLGSPEPDPCCNDSVRFSGYADYVEAWHRALLRLGSVGGATEVWLWHPSTPVWKGGLEHLQEILDGMRDDPAVSFVSAHELANWAYNRERVSIKPRYVEDGRLSELRLQLNPDAELAPLPPVATQSAATVSYWVIGDASPPGWQTRQWQDPHGRTITVMTQGLELPRP
jgi:hypothetical protein